MLKTNGAYHFAEALEENHRELEVVDLGFNEIGPDGGLVLVTALQNKPNLKRVNLDGNQVSLERFYFKTNFIYKIYKISFKSLVLMVVNV